KIKLILGLLHTLQDVRSFFTEKNIMPGELINQTIVEHIKGCDIFVVFFSEHAIKSSYVQQEIGVAKANNRPIIPILLDLNKPTGMLVGVNYLNFADASKQQTEISRLYVHIQKSIQKKKQDQANAVLGLLFIGYLIWKDK
ncbi:toll/interleukin-1 receptor domain-containing protein, partial [Candidatus Micrarchaeota archaeon]|nr:toll/interleukin-1 receptor domain-containing protein [Candidatus Micrarchaeota archaeon]